MQAAAGSDAIIDPVGHDAAEDWLLIGLNVWIGNAFHNELLFVIICLLNKESAPKLRRLTHKQPEPTV